MSLNQNNISEIIFKLECINSIIVTVKLSNKVYLKEEYNGVNGEKLIKITMSLFIVIRNIVLEHCVKMEVEVIAQAEEHAKNVKESNRFCIQLEKYLSEGLENLLLFNRNCL
jgi:hypothetical protein